MLGNLFLARGVQPDILTKMTIRELSYWYEWHVIGHNADVEQVNNPKPLRYIK